MNIKVVGFTGSRKGMTSKQKRMVKSLLEMAQERSDVDSTDSALLADYPYIIAVHGDCVGADTDFHKICRELGIVVQCRPCTLTNYRAFTDADAIEEPQAPLDRNKQIVLGADLMIAAPDSPEPRQRSGTWSTIRYTHKQEKHLFVVFPDGRVKVTAPDN